MLSILRGDPRLVASTAWVRDSRAAISFRQDRSPDDETWARAAHMDCG